QKEPKTKPATKLPEEIEEENWFFKLTKYKKEVRNKIESGELKIVPASKIPEVINLIDDAEDVSFSRSASSLGWGIPVPNDPEQIMYVWADALTNYISAIGYAGDTEQFQKLWPAEVHLIGKDILRFHSIYWPAMLLSAGLPLPKAIYVHGFITVEGEKMSKTIGNVVDPFVLIEKYGVEPVRYFLLREIPSVEDGDFSYKKLEERYNGDLANGLGNLVSRVSALVGTHLGGKLSLTHYSIPSNIREVIYETNSRVEVAMHSFKLHEALISIWDLIKYTNIYFDESKPWETLKTNPQHFITMLSNVVVILDAISHMIRPFMPETAEKIPHFFLTKEELDKLPESISISKAQPLFPRI
ncbi:MAG: methionine--tRNA ligase, partial [Patescibacteria group bacterium]